MEALIRLLPKLGLADAHLLATPARRALDTALVSDEGPVVEAILDAYSLVGDRSSLDSVIGVANSAGPSARAGDIRRKAAACRSAIETRMEQEANRAKLLRAVEAGPEEALLRPASSAATEPELLLRSTETE